MVPGSSPAHASHYLSCPDQGVISFQDWHRHGAGCGLEGSSAGPRVGGVGGQPVSSQAMFPYSLRSWGATNRGSRCLLPGFTWQVRRGECMKAPMCQVDVRVLYLS